MKTVDLPSLHQSVINHYHLYLTAMDYEWCRPIQCGGYLHHEGTYSFWRAPKLNQSLLAQIRRIFLSQSFYAPSRHISLAMNLSHRPDHIFHRLQWALTRPLISRRPPVGYK